MERDGKTGGHLDGFSDGGVSRLEVMEGPTGRQRRTKAERARIAAESLVPGTSVTEVARRHGATRWQVYDWRQKLRDGQLVVPESVAALPMFAELVVEGAAAEMPAETEAGTGVEIVVGGRRKEVTVHHRLAPTCSFPPLRPAERPGASIPAGAPVGSFRATAPSRTASAVAWGSTARWAGLASVWSFPAMTSPEELHRRPRRLGRSSRSDRAASDTRGVPRSVPVQAAGSSIHAATTMKMPGSTSIWTN